MARYIDLSDAAKGRVQRRALAKFDFDALLADIVTQAEAVKASNAKDSAKARRLQSLRIQYAATLSNRRFAGV